MTTTTTMMTPDDFRLIHDLISEKMECDVHCHLGMREDNSGAVTHDVRAFRDDADDIDTYNFIDLTDGDGTIEVLDLTRPTGIMLDVYVYDATEGWAIDTVNPEWNGTNWTV